MRRQKPSLLQRAVNVAWYATVGMKRSFQAARRSRLTQGWNARTSAGDANQVIYRDHETLRQRSREVCFDWMFQLMLERPRFLQAALLFESNFSH